MIRPPRSIAWQALTLTVAGAGAASPVAMPAPSPHGVDPAGIAERTAERVRNTSGAPARSEARNIGDCYASFMDEDGIGKRTQQ